MPIDPVLAQKIQLQDTADRNKSSSALSQLTAKGNIDNLLARKGAEETESLQVGKGQDTISNTMAGLGISVGRPQLQAGLDPNILAQLAQYRNARDFQAGATGASQAGKAGLGITLPGIGEPPATGLDIPGLPLKNITPTGAQAAGAVAKARNEQTDSTTMKDVTTPSGEGLSSAVIRERKTGTKRTDEQKSGNVADARAAVDALGINQQEGPVITPKELGMLQSLEVGKTRTYNLRDGSRWRYTKQADGRVTLEKL